MDGIVRLGHLTQGGADTVWLVNYDGRTAVQKRFVHDDAFTCLRYAREKFLYSHLAHYDLAPSLLAYDDQKRELVVEYRAHTQPKDKTDMFGRAPAIMAAASHLHSLPTAGFPHGFVADGWNCLKRKKIVINAFEEAELSEAERMRYTSACQQLCCEVADPRLDWNRPQLLHGDLHPWNALVCDDGKVRFIDFGRSRFGDPANDIGYLVYQTSRAKRFSDEETQKLLLVSVGSYPSACGCLLERARMFHGMRLVLDLPWLTKYWPTQSPPMRGTARAMALDNLARLNNLYAGK